MDYYTFHHLSALSAPSQRIMSALRILKISPNKGALTSAQFLWDNLTWKQGRKESFLDFEKRLESSGGHTGSLSRQDSLFFRSSIKDLAVPLTSVSRFFYSAKQIILQKPLNVFFHFWQQQAVYIVLT